MRTLALCLALAIAPACTAQQHGDAVNTTNKILAAARAVCRWIGAVPNLPAPDAAAPDASLPPIPNVDVAPPPSAPVSSGGSAQ
jgi:hypothetical protein